MVSGIFSMSTGFSVSTGLRFDLLTLGRSDAAENFGRQQPSGRRGKLRCHLSTVRSVLEIRGKKN